MPRIRDIAQICKSKNAGPFYGAQQHAPLLDVEIPLNTSVA
jgi:hypothetical protein